jgi:mono/diheme cytochrome c family protein
MDPEHILSERVWANTAFAKKRTDMVEYVLDEVSKFTPEQKQQLDRVIAALSAEAQLLAQANLDKHDGALIEQGRLDMGENGLNCVDCHEFRGEGGGKGPDLTGWASRDWTRAIIHDPAEKRFYGKRNDRMQSFGAKQELSPKQIEMIADWLRGDVK